MKVWRSLDAVEPAPSVVAVGVFDGVHRGHREVIEQARSVAESRGLRLVVLTFDPNPINVVRPDVDVPAVGTLRHRLAIFAELGVAATLVLPFDEDLASRSAEWFVTEVLAQAVGTKAVVVGEDFRFGHRALGDVAMLRSLGEPLGITVFPVGLVGPKGRRWSSTQIRQQVRLGEVAAANDALGYRFRVEGTVGRGDARGKSLGFPTANVPVAPGYLVPADGVYAGALVRLDGVGPTMPAAISVGSNPTFDGSERRVEAHVLPEGVAAEVLDLYDVDVAVEFDCWLRDMRRFDSVADLVDQVNDDIERTRRLGLG